MFGGLLLLGARLGDLLGRRRAFVSGAVGLSAVLAAKKLGAGPIIALSRNPARQAVAKEFGATDIVEERGNDAVKAVLRLTDGAGVDASVRMRRHRAVHRDLRGHHARRRHNRRRRRDSEPRS